MFRKSDNTNWNIGRGNSWFKERNDQKSAEPSFWSNLGEFNLQTNKETTTENVHSKRTNENRGNFRIRERTRKLYSNNSQRLSLKGTRRSDDAIEPDTQGVLLLLKLLERLKRDNKVDAKFYHHG